MSDASEDLKQTRVGMAAIVAALVKSVGESDPEFQQRFLENLGQAYGQLRDEGSNSLAGLELIRWTQSMITGFDLVTGQGEPFPRS